MNTYEIRIWYDGKYYIEKIIAKGEKEAVEKLESQINTAMEYKIFGVKKHL